ncbi:RNA polymerase sigma factor [Clostridium sp. ZS2-4]|uniref:RNA polymerase sigma factor n=1 Tax=Clostridium sp. ZS2-4 TaxID=2987703 RepID=UPI00227CA01C|nr:RNA polymerase sigma factor [Clostridium sp. ZS2-4]MCY6356186.1 RNA polymerase sigma factor [Clostridium sp. ZS2-4]
MINFRRKKQDNMKRFKELVSLVYTDLYKFIFCIVRNKASAEDILQDTLMLAYENFNSLRDHSKFKSWIFTIAKRDAVAFIKKTKREIPSENIILDLIRVKEESLTESIIINEELARYATSAINELKPEYREVIILKYYSELSFVKIAEVLNINVNTVRVHHMRAKQAIFKYMQKNYFENEVEADTLERKIK